MGILRRDKFGRLYETALDSEDGSGYKSHAKPVSEGDVTFGAVHSRSMSEHTASVRRDMVNRATEDRASEVRALRDAERSFASSQMGALADEALRCNEDYQEKLLLTGAMQGAACKCENGTVTDRTQAAITQAYMGSPVSAAFPVDPVEAYQAEVRAITEAQILQNARLLSKRNEAEAAASRTVPQARGLFQRQYVGPAPSRFVHPLQMMPAPRRRGA